MSIERELSVIKLHAINASATRATLSYDNLVFPCALGRSGRRHIKREGDGATPIGSWLLREIAFRPDRLKRPTTQLPCRALHKDDGWCDAPQDRNYNRLVTRPYLASSEALWRDDHLYDIIVILSHNDLPRIRGHGSAIFMHLARDGYAPSEGCVTLRAKNLLRLLATARPGSVLQIN